MNANIKITVLCCVCGKSAANVGRHEAKRLFKNEHPDVCITCFKKAIAYQGWFILTTLPKKLTGAVNPK